MNTVRKIGRTGFFAAALVGVVVVVKFVLLWLTDAIFAPPIVGMTAWLGFWKAFIISSVLYSAGSYVLAMAAVKGIDKKLGGKPSWLEHKLTSLVDKDRDSDTGRRIQRWIAPGGFIGITISGVLMGGIVTTGLCYYAGMRDNIKLIAAYSSVVFGISFAAFYAGGASAIF